MQITIATIFRLARKTGLKYRGERLHVVVFIVAFLLRKCVYEGLLESAEIKGWRKLSAPEVLVGDICQGEGGRDRVS
jgi:hypothetical protein